MSRPLKISLCIAGVLCLVAVVGWVLVLRWLSGGGESSAAEIPVTPSYAASMRSAGFPISVQRAFEAHSFGGWHGDGTEVTVYRYPPAESEALVAALKQKCPTFVWTEKPASAVTTGFLHNMLPADFLPASGASTLLVGRPREGLATSEFVVDRSRGILYSVSSRF